MVDIDNFIKYIGRICYGLIAAFDLMFCLGIIGVSDTIFPLLIYGNAACLLYLIVYYTHCDNRQKKE